MFDKIVDTLHVLCKMKWTGVIVFKIVFSDGGIRSCEKRLEEKIVLKNGS